MTLINDLLLELFHFLVKILLSLKYVTEGLMIPFFDLDFQKFEFLLESKYI